MTTTRRHSGGRPPKGNREQFSVRLPREHLAVFRKEAEALGIPVSDLIALLCARAMGLPESDLTYIWEDRERRRARQALRETNPNQGRLEFAS